jgi:hypothetical protein
LSFVVFRAAELPGIPASLFNYNILGRRQNNLSRGISATVDLLFQVMTVAVFVVGQSVHFELFSLSTVVVVVVVVLFGSA